VRVVLDLALARLEVHDWEEGLLAVHDLSWVQLGALDWVLVGARGSLVLRDLLGVLCSLHLHQAS
jgi:hypothetical protein